MKESILAGKRAAFHNLGCKVNSYETDAMIEALEKNGCIMTDFDQDADIYIVNTCSVTNIADRKSRQMLHRAKNNHPGSIVVAVGCYVQAAGEEILKDAGVDLAIGNNRKGKLAEILENYLEGRKERLIQTDIAKEKEYEEMERMRPDTHTRASLKVQDGCNQFCTYCIIPYTRGRIRSRKEEDVIAEVKRLSANGVKEVVLTGIHLSSYGLDRLRESGDYGGQTFAVNYLLNLIRSVSLVDGIERIRLGSLEPRIITDDFVKELSEMKKVCPHFHLSLQSGCNETLKRMNRHYTAEEYAEKCDIIRKYYDSPAITTDVIVGFPGETDEEFEITRQFLEKVNLYEMHIFKYSVRKGTVAEKMKDQVLEPVKTKRSNVLLKMAEEHSIAFRESFSGKKVQVLFEEIVERNGKQYRIGFNPEYVKFAEEIKKEEQQETGEIIEGTAGKMLTEELCEMTEDLCRRTE